MTRITTGCPRCGRVELDVSDVTLVRSPGDDTAWYVFDCTGCVHQVVKPAPGSVALALTSVQVTLWTVPAEVLERAHLDEHPPLQMDDVLDGLLWLRSCVGPPGWVTPSSSGEVGSRPAHPNAA